MTAPAIIDPDLEQAIADLHYPVRRLLQIEAQLLEPAEIKRYPDLARMLAERGDLRDQITARADKLNLPARALQLLVIEAENARSRAPGRRAVPLNKLLDRVRTVDEQARRDRAEANADLMAIQQRASAMTARSTGYAAAVAYLEASQA